MKVCRYWCHGRAGSTLLSLSLFIVNSRFQCTANIMLIPWTNSTHFILNQLLVKHLGTQIKAIEAVLQSPFHLFTLNGKKEEQIKFYSIFRVFVWNTISASPKFIRESFWELHFRATASTSWADPSALNCHFLAADKVFRYQLRVPWGQNAALCFVHVVIQVNMDFIRYSPL